MNRRYKKILRVTTKKKNYNTYCVMMKTKRRYKRCVHGNSKYYCKQCPGTQICQHQRVRRTCKDCGGSAICQHNRIRSLCKDCGGNQICKHQRVKYKCKDCGGSQICKHKRQKYNCKDCKGSQICKHQRIRSVCKECGGGSICPHSRIKSRCKECKKHVSKIDDKTENVIEEDEAPLYGDITCTRRDGYINFRIVTPYVEHPESQEVYEMDMTLDELRELLDFTKSNRSYGLEDLYLDHMFYNTDTQQEERRPGGKIGVAADWFRKKRQQRLKKNQQTKT